MPAPIALALPGLIGAAMDIYGNFRQGQQQSWENGLTMEQFNRRNAANERGVEAWNASADPARDSALQLQNLFMQSLYGDGGSQVQLMNLLQQYPGIMESLVGSGSDPFGRGSNPMMSSLLSGGMSGLDFYGQGANTAMQGFQGGGWTQPRETAQARFMDLLNGQGAEMGTLGDVGTDLLGRRGQTALTQDIQKIAGSALGAGGFNPENRNLLNLGMSGMSGGALGTAGMTEAGGLAALVGLQDLANGGRTAISTGLGNRGLDLANREALLPMEQAYQIAREDAARNTAGAFKKAQRAALARRGGSASVVAAGGSEDDPMSEWADSAARSVSDAGRQALMGQQSLGLNQMGIGANMAGAGGGLENSRYNAASGLVGAMEGNATQRYQANAGVADRALQNALGIASTYGNLGLGAGSLENSFMNTGAGLLDSYNRTRLGAGGLMNSAISDQGQYALGLGGLANNFQNSYFGANNNLFNNNLAMGQFGQGLNRDQLNAFQQYYGNMAGMNRDNLTGANMANTLLFNLAGQGMDYARAGLTGQNYGVTPASQLANPWSAIGQGIGNSNLGGLFGGGGTQSFNSGGFSALGGAAGQGLQNSWNTMINTAP